MNCLIVGGAGFIGSRTALRLASEGHNVSIFDALDPQIHGENLADAESFRSLLGKVKMSVGDARDACAICRALDGIDTVFYFAAGTGTGQSMYRVRNYVDVNVLAAAVFAEEISRRRTQIRRVVVSSSRAIYGEGAYQCKVHGRVFPQTRKTDQMENGRFEPFCPKCEEPPMAVASLEEDAARPGSIYGITKFAQEQIVLNACEAVGIPVYALRYQNVYGPGQSLKNPYTGILSIFSQLIMQRRPISLFEDGLATRDFVFIDDVVEFNCRAVTGEASGCHILNVGTGVRQSLIDVVLNLGLALRKEPVWSITGQFRLGDIRNAAAELTLLNATLGAHQFVPFNEGTSRFASWVMEQSLEGEAGARYSKSLDEMANLGLLRRSVGK